MLWYLISSAFLALGLGFDRVWTSCLLKDVLPPYFTRWLATESVIICPSPKSFVMGILQAFDAINYFFRASNPVPTTAATARLPAYPLAVKNPYLSAWVRGNELLNDAATAQPMFWNGIDLTWPIVARVDGKAYSLFGLPNGAPNITAALTTSVSYTSSHTYVRLTGGSVNFILDFFSPVLPGKNEYARQSLPYSYLTVTATTTRHHAPEVQVMSAIDYSWTAQYGASELNYTETKSSGFYQWSNPNEIPFTEEKDMATYGTVLFAADFQGNMTAGCGLSEDVFSTFVCQGSFHNDTLQGECQGGNLAGISKGLGKIGRTAKSAKFVVGFDRENAISYLNETQTGFYRTQWPTIPEAIDYFLLEYSSFFESSLSFDASVRTRAEYVSDSFGCKYADMVEASVRQVFGGMDLTVRYRGSECM